MNRHDPCYQPDFQFPPSFQSNLFSYLRDEQKAYIKPVLRVLKKHAQAELCCMLLDYMETGKYTPSNDIVIGGIFGYLTQADNRSEFSNHNKCIIRPFVN